MMATPSSSLSRISVSANVTRRMAHSLPVMKVPRNVHRMQRVTEIECMYLSTVRELV